MPKRTADYNSWRLSKLSNPETAARYLNAAMEDSPEIFLDALKNVAQANQVAKVAREAGIARENVYRAFSVGGNPTLDTLQSVLTAVGLRITIATEDNGFRTIPPSLRFGSTGSTLEKCNPVLIPDNGANREITDEGELGYASISSSQGTLASSLLPNANIIRNFLPGFLNQQQLIESEAFHA